MNKKKQILQVVCLNILLFLGIITSCFLPLASSNELSDPDMIENTSIIDDPAFSEDLQKLSSDLLEMIVKSEELSAAPYTNAFQDSMSTPATKSEKDLVFVYVGLVKGEQTSVIDPYVWNITSRDEDNSIAAAWVDVDRLKEIASLEEVRNIRTVVNPVVNTGSVNTAGDAIHRTDVVRSGYAQNGTGIKIGVISNGVDAISKAQASGDLPLDVTVVRNKVGGNEGIAMMEIIHDMVPGAKLYFHDHGNSVYEFNDAIDALVARGCNIIVDDITWPDEPFFEDGVIAKHVADIISKNNVLYISSAGNSGMRHYQGLFVDDGTGYHNKIFSLPKGTSYRVFLQWNDKFGSSANDYDLYVIDKSGKTIAFSTNRQTGNGDPLEWTTTPSLAEPAYIKIKNRDGTAQPFTLEMFIYPNSGMILNEANLTPEDSIFGHPAVPGVIAVSAISANDINHDNIESFSSRGPVTITYPTPAIREKPDLAGINRVAVSGAGNFGTIFSGTSASAPHIAAVAAQIWGSDKNMSASDVKNILYESAVDIESRGFDYLSGYGRADALNYFMKLNRAPILEAIPDREINETENLVITLIATDIDGDPLRYSTNASFGSLNGNVFSWTPTYDDAGIYTIEFSVTDGKDKHSRTVTITVNNVDRAPVIEFIGNKEIKENSLLEFIVSANDPDGDIITYSVDNLPVGATFDVNTGIFRWTPSADAVGNHQIKFTAEANGLSDSKTITITVGAMRRAPSFNTIGDKSVNENELLEFTVLANDPEGDIITYSAIGLPEGATFDGTRRLFSWRPDYNDSGVYKVIFVAEAGGFTDSENVTITVNNVDRGPELSPIGDKVVNENESLSFIITATDPDMDPITYLAVNLPNGASLNNVTGEFNWTPTYSDSGEYYVEFIANSNGLIKSEKILITVNNVDRAPKFAEINDQIAQVNHLLSFNISATDPDGDIVRYSALSLPAGAELNPITGDFNWIPVQAGNYTVTFIAQSNDLNDSLTIMIDVFDSAPFISDLTEKIITSGSVTLMWTNSPNVAYIEIYRNGTLIANVTGTISEYTDSNLDSNTSYEYSLLPYDANGIQGNGINITLVTSSPSSSNAGGGGSSTIASSRKSSGGGGTGGGTSEDFSNILLKDVNTVYITSGNNITYEFSREGNPIQTVSFYSLKNSGEITSTVEVLNNRSKLVSSEADGYIYKYVNIWVGKSGFATSSNIKDISIKFKVDNSWMQDMGVDAEDIRLQRYNGDAWEILSTDVESSTSEYSIFRSTSTGFSPFAITAEKVLASPSSMDSELEPIPAEKADIKESQPKSNIWSILISIVVISLLVVGYNYVKKR
ncbi:MAG: PGF-pre-PGF domain-containing protein [Methanomethylovorans sp.]|nr:PGF-pre-PGF domain-containing protein [Methanomethylovorans sp.]